MTCKLDLAVLRARYPQGQRTNGARGVRLLTDAEGDRSMLSTDTQATAAKTEGRTNRTTFARIAIACLGGEPVLGVVSFRARTDANLDTRNVVVSGLDIISVRFPSLQAPQAAAMESLVRNFLLPSTGGRGLAQPRGRRR